MLPPEHGKWNSVFKRYSRWYARGAWVMLLAKFSRAADLQNVSIDDPISRAHACAAGYQKESAEQEALGHAKAALAVKFMRFVMLMVCQSTSP
jgi:hypothetical protein